MIPYIITTIISYQQSYILYQQYKQKLSYKRKQKFSLCIEIHGKPVISAIFKLYIECTVHRVETLCT